MKQNYKNVLLFQMLLLSAACGDFLDAKPELSLVIPKQLNEYQAILDAEPRQMNYAPKIPLLGADEMELGEGAIPWLTQEELAAYSWEGDYYAVSENGVDWLFGYQPIYYANVVIDGIKGFVPTNETERALAATLDASARFYRAWSHFQLLQIYAMPYSPDKNEQAGIPIRNSSDINLATGISDQATVYRFILDDLEKGYESLPEKNDLKTRPSKWAVEALRSRIYLQMQEYEKAVEAATKALAIGGELMDFKELTTQGSYYFPRFNQEVIFHANQASTGITFDREQWVDSELYLQYDSSDLRKSIFFRESRVPGKFNFVSRYSGDYFDWGGLAVDEVVLDRAEASARIGNDLQALDDLNHLLVNRYGSNFVLLDLSGAELMGRILLERRKELLFRGIRWMDLRRLNQDPEFAITLKRMVQGDEKILLPEGKGYTIPIPVRELKNNPLLN